MLHRDDNNVSKIEVLMRRPACLWSIRTVLVKYIPAACVIFTLQDNVFSMIVEVS
jgi:hypothetical protein